MRANRPRRTRGFLLIDLLVGLSVAGMAALVLVMTMQQYHHTAGQLAQVRTQTRIAEAALTDMQRHRIPATTDAQTTVRVRPLADGQTLAGDVWVEVTVQRAGRQIGLTGVVPRAMLGALPAGMLEGGRP